MSPCFSLCFEASFLWCLCTGWSLFDGTSPTAISSTFPQGWNKRAARIKMSPPAALLIGDTFLCASSTFLSVTGCARSPLSNNCPPPVTVDLIKKTPTQPFHASAYLWRLNYLYLSQPLSFSLSLCFLTLSNLSLSSTVMSQSQKLLCNSLNEMLTV